MVLTEHKKFYSDIFKINGFLDSPFLMFGFQKLSKGFDSKLKDAESFKGLLYLMGIQEITVLDYEDKRADIHFDMNYPFDQDTNKLYGKYKVVCDIGCLEHVFNSAQAMKNCMDAVKVGGLYVLHTPVSGYCKHGFHTFNPNMLKWVLEHNGFEIEYEKYSYKNGIEIEKPLFGDKANILIWLVARRVEVMNKFHIPIQNGQAIHESRKTVNLLHIETKGKLGPINDPNSKLNIVGMEASKAGEELKEIMQNVETISKKPKKYATGGYVSEGHDPVNLSNQNLGL